MGHTERNVPKQSSNTMTIQFTMTIKRFSSPVLRTLSAVHARSCWRPRAAEVLEVTTRNPRLTPWEPRRAKLTTATTAAMREGFKKKPYPASSLEIAQRTVYLRDLVKRTPKQQRELDNYTRMS